MAQMYLTSPARAMLYTGLVDEAGEDPVNLRSMQTWIPGVSSRIEQYLSRKLHIEQYTEYWDSREDMIEYLVTAGAPIFHIASVMASSMGLYTGEEYLIINYYIARFGNAVSLNYPVSRWRKGLRAIYTGGYAYHGTKSTYAIGSVAGSWIVGKYVTSGTNATGAMGTVAAVSTAGNYITIDNLYGIFNVGDTLTEQDAEFSVGASTGTAVITASSEAKTERITMAVNTVGGTWAVGKYVKGMASGCIGIINDVGATYITCTWYYTGSASTFFMVDEVLREQNDYLNVGTADGTAVLTAFVQRALCEAYPEITTAAEIELRYMIKHQHDLENQSTMKEQTSRRPDLVNYTLQPETRALLSPHMRFNI